MRKPSWRRGTVPVILVCLSLAALIGGQVHSQQTRSESETTKEQAPGSPHKEIVRKAVQSQDGANAAESPQANSSSDGSIPVLVAADESSSAQGPDASQEPAAIFLPRSDSSDQGQAAEKPSSAEKQAQQGGQVPDLEAAANAPAPAEAQSEEAGQEAAASPQDEIMQTGAQLPFANENEPEPEAEQYITGGSRGIPDYAPSLGSQTASLSIDWVMPDTILIGQEGLFELVVRNRGRVAVNDIAIEQVVPEGFRLVKANPQPQRQGDEPVWNIRRLAPQEEARIALRLVPQRVGDAESKARVNFNTSSIANFRVVEPKLEVTAEAPDKVLLGDQAVFHVTVHNPGSGPATGTALKVNFPEHLKPVKEKATYSLGTLKADESRSLRILAEATALGDHTTQFTATADHGLRDEARKRLTALGAKLDVAVDGPSFRYVSRPASYKVSIRNDGTAAASNVLLQCRVPKAFAFLASGESGRFDSSSKTINWYVGELGVGEEFQGTFKLRAEDRGRFPIIAQANADRGLKAEDRHFTKVEGIAAILLEVVDADDPVEVNNETFYEILVTNQGTDFARNVTITAEAPEGMKIVGSKGPSRGQINGQTIRFAPLPKLAPLADAIYRVKIRSSKPGDLRIKVRANAETLDSPVTELESTKVYQDK